MKCLRVFSILSVISLILCSVAYASQDVSFDVYSEDDLLGDGAYFVSDAGVRYSILKEDFNVYESEELLEDSAFFVLSRYQRSSFPVIGDEPPSDPLFYGSCWVTGTDPNLGEVTIYFPLSCKEDTWGVDSNGYLYNITSGSVSGYLEGVYNNSVSASGFAYPRYREGSGAGYSNIDLHLTPTNSNMEIATVMEPAQNATQLLPYVYVSLLGVIIVCFMKRF